MREVLDLKQTSEYLHVGMTTTRKLVRDPSADFAFRIGAKWLVDKGKLDKWIDNRMRGGHLG